MKLKSLILGSVAAAGLSTAGFAADLGVLTSLDVCDELGLSGLTISSDTNCLQISGGVKYEFYWGDYKTEPTIGIVGLADSILGNASSITIPGPGGVAGSELDWRSKASAWLKFVGTANSDFGRAQAVIKLEYNDRYDVLNEGPVTPHADNGLGVAEAYVSIGDTTVIMAGKKGTIGLFGDSKPFNYLGLFGVGKVDSGVLLEGDEDGFGGHVIQIVSDLGNGVTAGLGLENLGGKSAGGGLTGTQSAGTLVGTLGYSGEGITAHATGFAGGILDGTVDFYGIHAGATGTFDAFKLGAAVGYLYNANANTSKLHALLTGEAAFDIFKIALSGEYVDNSANTEDGYGVGGSVGATVTEGIDLNIGGRWWHNTFHNENTVQAEAQVVAAVTETIKVTAAVGAYWDTFANNAPWQSVGYGSLALGWNPNGGFTSSIKGEAYTNGAYKLSFTAEKKFD
jgi:hypothetical protein